MPTLSFLQIILLIALIFFAFWRCSWPYKPFEACFEKVQQEKQILKSKITVFVVLPLAASAVRLLGS